MGHKVTSVALPPLPQGATIPEEMEIVFGDINKNVAGIFSATPNLQNIRFLYGHLSSPWCIMYEDVHFRQKEKREGFYVGLFF